MKGGSNAPKNAIFGYRIQKLGRVKVFLVDVQKSFLQHTYKYSYIENLKPHLGIVE